MKDELTVADDLLFDAYRKFKALDGEGVTDERERARRELKIFAEYFTPLAGIAANPHSDGKTTTARAFIAEHIHPGYMLIPGAIDLYAKWAPTIPAQDRAELLEPFRALLIVTAVRWPDAKPQALNVLAVVDEISGVSINTDAGISQAAANQLLAMFGRFDRELRAGLKALSEALFRSTADNGAANADRADKTLAAINAARDDIAAVGADARAARVAAERAAAELADWREWVELIGKPNGGRGARSSTPPLCRPMADAVCMAWNNYESGTADCELPNGKWRKIKRTYGECLEAHGADTVYHSNATGRDYTLSELAPDADTFKRIVNAGRMRETRKPAPTRKRKNAHATHKRARK